MQVEFAGIMEKIADLLMKIVEPLQGFVSKGMDMLSGIIEKLGSTVQPILSKVVGFVGPCMEPCRFLYCSLCGLPTLLCETICCLPSACFGNYFCFCLPGPNLLALSLCYPQLLGYLADLLQPLCYL
jgi:hypothetical protein